MLVAAVQMNSTKNPLENMQAAKTWIEEAAKQGARLVLLPEMFACIGVVNQYDLAKAHFSQEKLEASVGTWAKDNGIFVVAGSLPLVSGKEKKVHAASLVFSPEGKIIAQYNKIHLFDVTVGDEKGAYRESDTFLAGAEPVVSLIDDKKLGLSICYDVRFPELYQHYQKKQCDMLVVPAAFTYKTGEMHWETLLKARAIETQSFVIAANQCGVHEDGRRTWGHTMIISAQGEILAQVTEDAPGLALANLDFDEMALIRSSMPLFSHKSLS